MLRKTKAKVKTVSEKVSELISKENGFESSDDSAEEATAPKVIDFEEDYDLPDARSSDIRKRNVKLLSEQSARYKGKIASRKDFEEDTSDEEDESESETDTLNAAVEEENDSIENESITEEDSESLNTVDKISYDSRYESLAEEESGSETEALKAFKKQVKVSGKSKSKALNKSNDSSEKEYKFEFSDSEDDDDDESELGEEEEGDEDADSDSDDADGDGDAEEEEEEEQDSDDNAETSMIAETNRQAELQKGVCVQNQLRIWEKLLEMRINTQKLLSKANQLPPPEQMQGQQQNEQMKDACTESTQKVGLLLNTLLQLQNALSSQFSELKGSMKTSLKRASPYEAHKNGAPPFKRIAENLDERFQEFRSYRNAVLLKWDDRTKLLTPGAGAKRKSLNEEYDIIRKIDNALMNRSALIVRTQTTKGNNEPAPADDQNTEDTTNDNQSTKLNVNIYDDSDFYHQQLRELIEYKASTSSNISEITKQFIELQKLRHKMKKKVDTRASKGRKIRYTVHNKLINFMAPDETANTWTDDSKNELFKSLFST